MFCFVCFLSIIRLLQEKLYFNQVTHLDLKQICQELELSEKETNIIVGFFWKVKSHNLNSQLTESLVD